MTPIDYIVIAAYLAFVLALGPVYRRFSSTASDYFRAGGGMLWWMVGASAWVMTFSAWTFTGGAGRAYESGTFFLLLAGANFCGLVFTFFFTAHRFRQMRVVTVVEAVRNRFGPANEQFFAWMPVPFGIIFGGIGLYAIGIFMSVVFGVSLPTVIITLGIVVTIMAVMGGAFAVIASDFVQMLTILTITLVMAVLALAHPAVGGVTGLIEGVPAAHFDWTEAHRPWILILFIFGLLVTQTIQPNSLNEGAQKFIYVKSGFDAKRALVISMVGTVVITPIFILPAMAARIVHPDLATQFPGLNNPSEAAYVVMAMELLPTGMLGLLVCGIFAATMSSMDTGLNRAAGILVRNVYRPLINPEASERTQIATGKALTVVLGSLQIIAGLIFAQYQTLPLFDLILLMSAVIGLPMAVPLFFGIFIKRTPPWAGWSTVLVGFCMFLVLNGVPVLGITGLTAAANLQAFVGARGGEILSDAELASMRVAITTGANFSVCLAWFLGTMFFWKGSPRPYREQVDAFFKEMNTPIDEKAEGVAGWKEDRRHYHVMGVLCMCYGGFILLLMCLPNPLWGRAAFLFCGGSIAGLGVIFYWISKRQEPDENPQPAPMVQRFNQSSQPTPPPSHTS